MNTSQLESTWGALKGKLKQHYGQLTDDDLTFVEGKGEELLSRLQAKLGISRGELNSVLDDLAATAQEKWGQGKAKAAEVTDQVYAKARNVYGDVRQRAVAVGEEAQAQGAAAYDEAQRRVRGLWEDGAEYVRTNPRESLLVAVAAGFVAGIIFSRR